MPLPDSPRYLFLGPLNPISNQFACRSDYREYPVSGPLQEHLLCFWTQSIIGPSGFYTHNVLPDACIDIVFINDGAPILVGPWQKSFLANFPHGTEILGVRFHPGKAAASLKVPAFELLNLSVPVRDVCGQAALPQFTRILDQPSLAIRRAMLEAVMFSWLSRSNGADRSLHGALHWLARHPGGRIDRLCERMGISSRQLRRRFLPVFGYGPKSLQSVLRFQRLLHLAGRSPDRANLALLAAEAGYADQSHMTREVRRFSGEVPTLLLGSAECTLRLSEIFRLGGRLS